MSAIRPSDVVLLCNPRAGGRWHTLADVLDSDEAKLVRRIVTDDIDDVSEAIAGLGQRVRLLCIYGGDGTVNRIIGELLRRPSVTPPRLALLGGGTMNVTASWCGMSSSPGENFRAVMRAYLSDRLVWREVPLLAVTQDGRTHYGFTFGAGPLIRILDRYEHGTKGRLPALAIGVESALAAVSGYPRSFQPLLREMEARLVADGAPLPFHRFAGVFANTTGVINPFVEPFVAERTRDSFHFLAYAVSAREFALLAPLLARAMVPIDPKSVLRPLSTWRQALLTLAGRGLLPLDPRYINRPARELTMHTDEALYTLDGELLPVGGQPLEVRLGPQLHLAVLKARRPPRRARRARTAE
jgi:diacylglycerol kinase family enzyme